MATSKQTSPRWVERTITVHGIELPWERRKAYAPRKDSLLESGVVFIPADVLEEVAERTVDDYLWGRTPPQINYHHQLALEQAGLAERETRGGCHGTDKLRRFLKQSWAHT